MQWLQELSFARRILVYAVVAAVALAVAAGVGAMAALTLGPAEAPPEGGTSKETGRAKPEGDKGADPGGGGRAEDAAEQGASDRSNEAAYLDEVADIQNGAVEASLRSNDKLLRYDRLTAADVKEMESDSAALVNLDRRAENLNTPSGYEDQHEELVLAINELRDANDLAYRLAADPASATQDDFEAYDEHINSATSHLERSNEILGRDYQTTAAAQRVSVG